MSGELSVPATSLRTNGSKRGVSQAPYANEQLSRCRLTCRRCRGVQDCPLPPLTEQRKIAAILSSVDDAIEKTQAVIDQVQVVKRGLMQELLTRGLPQHTRYKRTEIGTLPEAWDVVTLGDIAAVKGGKRMPKGRPFSASVMATTPIFVCVTSVNGTIDSDSAVKYVLLEDHRTDTTVYDFQTGDFTFHYARHVGNCRDRSPELARCTRQRTPQNSLRDWIVFGLTTLSRVRWISDSCDRRNWQSLLRV